MLQSAALAFLALSGVITLTHLLALSAFQGLINAFDTPARQAFVVEMVEEPGDLPNAIALNSTMFNGARLVGPSVAGVLVAAVGEGWCFLIDAVSYLAVIASLLAMRVIPRVRPARTTRVLQELGEGFRYAFGFRPIRAALMLLAVGSLAGMPFAILMPVIAAETHHGGPNTLGWLLAASGVGALMGAFYLASRRTVLGLGRTIAIAAGAFGLSLVAFGLSRSLPLSLLLMIPVGAGFMVHMASTNTVLQTIVRDEMRGRVMAFYTMAFMGTAPFGSLLAGALASRIGAPQTILVGGALVFFASLVFGRILPVLREQVRPIYRSMGILPEIAVGMQGAAALRNEAER
jgi:MFS family permease